MARKGSPPRRRGRSFAHRRRGVHSTYGALEVLGGAIAAGTVATQTYPDGQPTWMDAATGDFNTLGYKMVQVTNPFGGPYGSDPNYESARLAFWSGIGLFVGGRVLRKVVPGLHRHGLKIGKHTRLAVV